MSLAIVGHRGALAEAPENTVAAYRAAEDVGVDEIETDVRISADGQLFMLHDSSLDRVAIESSEVTCGDVAALPWSVIGAVDVGAGLRVPTLDQMYAETTTRIQLEVKDPAAIDALVDYLTKQPAAAARTIITSFNVAAVAEVSHRLPHIPRGVIVGSWSAAVDHPGGPDALIKETAAHRMLSGWEGLTPAVVAGLHEAGLEVHGWPCRDRADLQRAIDLGLDGTTCDDPRTVMGWLQPASSH